MRICHIVSHIDEEASGPSYSVPRLAQAVARQGHTVVLATLDRGGGTRDLGPVNHRAFTQAAFPRKLGRSPAMRAWLAQARDEGFALLHSHGLWMLPNLYPVRAAIPHIVAPRGTLDPAALVFSRRLKRAVWYLGQGEVLRRAAALHATSEQEACHIRAQNLRQPIILSPNGIDIPLGSRPSRGDRRRLLYLGRLHNKKGLDMLIAAWAALEPAHPNWDLRIVGKGDHAFGAALARDIVARGLRRVTVEPPAYGAAKQAAFAAADLFVLPTRGENFGMVVAEALAAGTPVLTTTGAPWQGLVGHRAGWWCLPEADALAASLNEALALPHVALEEMGARGRAWMQAEYGWDEVGARLCSAYEWVLHGGPVPRAVLRD
jgi:glycosyltransferase involved in cell wall biosynthesis